MRKLIKYIILFLALVAIAAGIVAHYHRKAEKEKLYSFDAATFRKINYMQEDIELFCDIAFNRKGERIRKWDTDIRVEIKNINDIDETSIKEVDSIIAILSPLIAPLSIERVLQDGNVHVYRRVESVPVNRNKNKPSNYRGIARINEVSDYSWNITFAQVYDGPSSNTQTLMHEFEHVLGIEHPLRIYPYYLTIGRSVNPQDYTARREWRVFHNVPYYLSEQEKSVIRMLYCPEIKSGLHKETFKKIMDMK